MKIEIETENIGWYLVVIAVIIFGLGYTVGYLVFAN